MSNFSLRTCKIKYHSWCKSCSSKAASEREKKKRQENPEYGKLQYQKQKTWARSEEGLAYFREYDIRRYRETIRGEKQREYMKAYRANNKDKTAKWSMDRLTRKSQACPPWLTKEHHRQMEEFYFLARDCSIVGEGKYEVDHIHPLKGKNFCGLHVPWNLQVLPKDVNISKGNKLEGAYGRR